MALPILPTNWLSKKIRYRFRVTIIYRFMIETSNFNLLIKFVTIKVRHIGHVPFDQNFRKFRFKIEWNRTFPEIRFEHFGSPLEVVLFSGNLEIPEISCSI